MALQFAERDRRIQRDSWIERRMARRRSPEADVRRRRRRSAQRAARGHGRHGRRRDARFVTNSVHTVLLELDLIPERVGLLSMRLPKPRPTGNQVYFIGACMF